MSTFCNYFNQFQCRSCSWLDIPYEEQLVLKQKRTEELLEKPVDLIVRSALQNFRTKAKLAVTGTVENPILGLTGRESLDLGQELLRCPIHHPSINEVLASVPGIIQKCGLVPYRIADRTGELKGIILFVSDVTGEMYFRWIIRSTDSLERIKMSVPLLQKKFPNLKSISANLQPVPHAILEGEIEIALTDRISISHVSGSVPLFVSPQAFVQTNGQVARQLYQTAAKWVSDSGTNRFAELYCGQGAFSFEVARSRIDCMGIEFNSDAVEMARKNADSLGITNAKFTKLDALEAESILREFEPDAVLVNPPRRGIESLARVIKTLAPKAIFYSSCNISSLAKDLKVWSESYTIVKTALFDMFPHTPHFEILISLERF